MTMPRTFRIIAAACVLLLAGAAGPAWAQATRAPASPGGNPSDKLKQSGGVIAPNRDIDPKMQVRPPDPGPTSTPVIPPPGSPGGNPNVIPK
jgi:hypothetical protein